MRRRSLALLLVCLGLARTTPAAAIEPTVAECLGASERGQRERDDGHWVQAHRSFVTCSSAVCPAVVQSDCTRWLLEVDANVPTMVFVVRDANDVDVGDVVVKMDGGVLTTRLDGKPVAVDPGEHVFTFEAGSRRVERRAIVNVGERNRVLHVALGAPARSTEGGEPARVPVGTWVLGGIGVAALGTSIALWVSARSDLSSIESSPCAASRTCDASDVHSVERRLVVGDVLAGVSVLAIGAAVWLLLTRDRAPAASAGAARW